MLRHPWLLAALLPPRGGAQAAGHSKCPCLSGVGSALDSYKDGNNANCATPQSDDGLTHCYPLDYGGAGCKAYEDLLPPSCATTAGVKLSDRPAWCDDSWCWVDANNCDADFVDDVLPSVMFPQSGLTYSYGTCGNSQQFAKWQYARNQTASQLKSTTEGYMKEIRDTLEQHVQAVATDEASGNCEGRTELACECTSCEAKTAWVSQATPGEASNFLVDFTKSNTIVKSSTFKDTRNSAMNQDKCTAGLIGKSLRKVALREYNDDRRIAYMYYGSQSTGAMVQWPASKYCGDFDSRMRPWYATAASGPKDVVLVLDQSGSMNTAGRWPAVQTAAKKVLATLGEEDFATVITFETKAKAYDEATKITLHRMTDNRKKKMGDWIDEESAIGGTNFRSGLVKAGQAFTAARDGPTSKCTQILLFLTDGVDTEGFKAKDVKSIPGLEGVIFMTYSMGNDIGDQQVVKKMACQNQGIWHKVPDGGDIPSIMASYYQIFAASLDAKYARWVEYNDALTGTRLVAACYSVYDRTKSVPLLNGVACMDLNVIIDLDAFKTKPGYSEAWSAMRAAATSCTRITLSAAQLTTFRELQGGDCRACDMTDEHCSTEDQAVNSAVDTKPLLFAAALSCAASVALMTQL
eukprot:TRINITY_DN8085_c0_g2_i1.p1 TRINITY_DN8085_c0_g2~~TRINITY_DN8085_c0_g2_i1.p1  ORF type:complete len:635 (+),score=90.21 TRINITY_DN8085_c0_g2_i1:69-1973(+)